MITKILAKVLCVEWHTIYPWSLGKDSVVLDLGANHGSFSEKMTKVFGCKCHAIEASPELYEQLKPSERIFTHHYAIASCEGTVTFNLSSQDTASSILLLPPEQKTKSAQVPGISLEGFLNKYGIEKVDLIKMDIEGAEVSVFDSTSDEFLSQIPQITIELHDFCNPKLTPDSDVKRLVKRFQKLGFFYLRMSNIGNQDVLLINRKLLKVSLLECLYIKYIVRNFLGFMRVIWRYFKVDPHDYPYYI